MNASWIKYLPAALRERIEGRQQLQRAVGNTGWLFAEKLLRMVIGFLVTIWVTRYLGPEKFGQLSYATSFVLLFSFLAMLGLDGVVIRNLVRNPTNRDEVLGTAFLLKLLGGLVAFVFAEVTIIIVRPHDYLTWLLVAIISIGILSQAFTTIDFWFQSQVQSKYSAYARTGAFLVISAVKAALIINHAPLTAFAWAGAADMALCSAALVLAYRLKRGDVRKWRATKAMTLELMRDCWPLLFSDVLILVYMRVDKIMIGEIAGLRELGIYAVAAMIAEALYLIPTVITSSVFPSIVEAQSTSDELFQERLQKLYNLLVFLAYAVALPITFLADWLVPAIFGPHYSSAAPMLVILVWAGVFTNLLIARSYYLTAMNWTRLHLLTDFLGCLFNIFLYYLLIPRYGGMGAAVSSLIAYWFVAHGLCFAFKPLVKTGNMMTKAILLPKIW